MEMYLSDVPLIERGYRLSKDAGTGQVILWHHGNPIEHKQDRIHALCVAYDREFGGAFGPRIAVRDGRITVNGVAVRPSVRALERLRPGDWALFPHVNGERTGREALAPVATALPSGDVVLVPMEGYRALARLGVPIGSVVWHLRPLDLGSLL